MITIRDWLPTPTVADDIEAFLYALERQRARDQAAALKLREELLARLCRRLAYLGGRKYRSAVRRLDLLGYHVVEPALARQVGVIAYGAPK